MKEIFEAYKDGNEALVRELSKKIELKDVARKKCVELSEILRKSGMPYLGVKLLNPVIRNEKLNELASDNELVEYACSLYRLGLNRESERVLTEVKSISSQKLLFLSFNQFSRWDYLQAEETLIKYLALNCLDEQSTFLGKLNLSAAFIFLEKFEEAQNLLEQCRQYASKKKLKNYEGYVYELKAQIYFYQNDYKNTQIELDRASKCFVNKNSFGNLFVLKWSSLLKLKSHPNEFKKVYRLAKKLKHYETLRSMKFYEGKILKNKRILEKVYWGTPYHHFKKMILNSNSNIIKTNGKVSFGKVKIGYHKEEGVVEIDSKKIKLKPLSLERRLMDTLSEDFFKPKTCYQIFEKLYPGEFFHLKYSINKTHKMISRVNQKFNCITHEDGSYTLKNVRVFFQEERTADPYLKVVLSEFRGDFFSAKELALKLNTSHRQTNRIIKGLYENNKLIKEGKARSIKYKVSIA